MSLIQEALRRQQEDMDDNSGAPPIPSTPTVPPPDPKDPPTIAAKAPVEMPVPDMDTSAPPPVQDPPQVEQEDPPPPPESPAEDDDADSPPPPPPGATKGEKPGMKVAVMVVVAVLCLGIGVWAVTFAVQKFMSPTVVETPADPDSSNPTPDAPAPDDPPPVAPPTPEPVPVEPAPSDPVEPPVAEPVPVEPDPIVAEPVVWPILMINAFVGKGAQGAVMINSEIVGVDESIEGVRVVSITKQGCELKYEGETKFVKVGGTTE